MYQLIYNEEKQALIQVDPNGKETIIADEFPSLPEYSPDGNNAIYISPLEWEVPGSLYLYDLQNGLITEIIRPDMDNNIPKYAIWINNEVIAVVIGFGHGTVQIGGNVFLYNISNNQLKQITKYPDKIQITKLILKDESLQLLGIEYTDDIYNEFKDFETKIDINKYT